MAGINFSVFVDLIFFLFLHDKLDKLKLIHVASYKQCYMFTGSLFVNRLEGVFSGKLRLIQCHLATPGLSSLPVWQ